MATSTLPSQVPTRDRNCYLTPPFSGVPEKGPKSKVATSHVPSWGPTRGRNYYITPAFSGVLNKGDKIKKWLPHTCLLGSPQEGGIAT